MRRRLVRVVGPTPCRTCAEPVAFLVWEGETSRTGFWFRLHRGEPAGLHRCWR